MIWVTVFITDIQQAAESIIFIANTRGRRSSRSEAMSVLDAPICFITHILKILDVGVSVQEAILEIYLGAVKVMRNIQRSIICYMRR